MELKPGYKQTEVGVIPKDWDTPRLGELLSFKNGINKGKESFGHGTLIVNYMDVYNHPGMHALDLKGLVEVNRGELESFAVKKGDVFFTRTSETVAEVGIASVMLDDSPNTVFSGFVLRARPKDDSICDQYKKYCFSSSTVRKQITSKATYTTRALTNGRVLAAILLPLPPTKAEQNAIGKSLSDTDSLIESIEQLIAKKRDFRQGTMQELLTGKKRLPGFGGEWVEKRLGDLADMASGGTPASSVPAYYGGDIHWVSISDMTRAGKFITDTEKCLTPAGFENCAAKMFPIGTVLYAMYASLGECGIASIPLCSSQAILGIQTKAGLDNGFLYYCLSSLKSTVKKMGQQGTQTNLNKAMVRSLTLRLPPHPEQVAIATILSDIDIEIVALEERLTKAEHIKKGMMQALLTGRIRLI